MLKQQRCCILKIMKQHPTLGVSAHPSLGLQIKTGAVCLTERIIVWKRKMNFNEGSEYPHRQLPPPPHTARGDYHVLYSLAHSGNRIRPS